MILPLSVYEHVIMSVDKCVYSETAHRIFLKLLIKLGCVKGKKLTELDFLGKNIIFGIMPKNIPKIGLFGFCRKSGPLMCRFSGFKLCFIMTFMIL